MRVTVRIQAALTSRPSPHRSGGRRLIAGQPHYQHSAACMAHFGPADIYSPCCFRCQYVTACCCSPNVSIPADWRSLFNRQECHRGRASAAHLCQRAEWYQQSPTLCPSCSFQYSVLSAANDGYELKEEITVFNILREEQNKQNPSKTFYSVHTKQTKKKNKGTKSTSQHICN